jgi:hypothetical protein
MIQNGSDDSYGEFGTVSIRRYAYRILFIYGSVIVVLLVTRTLKIFLEAMGRMG